MVDLVVFHFYKKYGNLDVKQMRISRVGVMILMMAMTMTNKDVAVAYTKQRSEQGPEGRAGREGDL